MRHRFILFKGRSTRPKTDRMSLTYHTPHGEKKSATIRINWQTMKVTVPKELKFNDRCKVMSVHSE